MKRNPIYLITYTVISCISCVLFFSSQQVLAQPSFTATSTIKTCDDYATDVLHNPWDMSDSADVNNFISNDVESLSNLSFSSGLFNFTNTSAAAGHFYLLSPQIDNLQPVGGRWGQNFPIPTRYRYLTVRMNASQESSTFGLRVLWHRGKLGASDEERTITNLGTIPVVSGFNSYSIDLAGLSSFDGVSKNAKVWSNSPLHGFGLYPFVSTGSGQIDYIRLEDSDTCGSASINYSSSATATNDLLSFYLDDDANPSNGYLKKLSEAVTAASGSTVVVNSLGIMPGTYKIVSRFDSDYAALERDNAWDMNENSDFSATQEISGGTFGSGVYSGTTSGSSPSVFFNIPQAKPINASKYDKLSLKVTRSVAVDTNTMLLVWEKTAGGIGQVFLDSTADGNADNVFQIDLSGNGDWSGTIKSIRLQLATGSFSNISFNVDFLQIRSAGLVTVDTSGSDVVGTGDFVIADRPRIQLLQPDIKGGELFKPWDMKQGDFGFSLNADSDTDSSFPAESKTSYLPDVRSYEGVRGDLYKVTNIAGNGDPNDFFSFPFLGQNTYTINADEYTNLCIKMALNRDYDLALGSVTKHFYKRTDGEFQAADAWATIYDRWSSSRWYEYCLDAANHPTEDGQYTWAGTLESFRMDPHEFSYDSCCDANGNPIGNPIQASTYYDYVRLAKRDRSYGKFALPYQVQDSDTAAPTISFSYSTDQNFGSSTAIPSGDLSCQGRICIWDTTGLANGNYYIRATVTDGVGSTAAVSSSFLKILNGQGQNEIAPVLALENPTTNLTVCDNIQIKGYAVNDSIDEPVVGVQVFFDGTFQSLVVPNEYSPASKAAYPSRLAESGFNFTLPVTSLGAGAHTIRVRAYSSNGGVATQDVSVVKSSSCQDTVVSDSTPSGVPVPGTVSGGQSTPAPSVITPTIKSAGLSKSGVFTVSLTGLDSTVNSCSVSISIGADSGSLQQVKNYPIANSNAVSGKYDLEAKGVNVNKKKLKKFTVGAKFVCDGTEGTAATRSVSVKTDKGAPTIAKLVSTLKKKLAKKDSGGKKKSKKK